MRAKGLLVACLVVAGGCSRKSDQLVIPTELPRSSRAERASADAGEPTLNSASWITDAKLVGFAAYRRELIPMNKLAMGMAPGSGPSEGANGADARVALSAEERIKRLTEASEAALVKAGITMADVSALTPILTPYYVQRGLGNESEEALAQILKRKADGKPQPADEELAALHDKKVQEVARLRAEYEAKYGRAAMEVIDRHEQEFIELGKAELESVVGK